jgi:hypothetical protein
MKRNVKANIRVDKRRFDATCARSIVPSIVNALANFSFISAEKIVQKSFLGVEVLPFDPISLLCFGTAEMDFPDFSRPSGASDGKPEISGAIAYHLDAVSRGNRAQDWLVWA